MKKPKVIAIAAQKGGVGKSTLAVHMATYAAQNGLAVILLDADAQGSASGWAGIRNTDDPLVAKCAPGDIATTLKHAQADVVFIDTAPAHSADITAVAKLADLTLIPTRPAIFDLMAITPTIDLVAAVKRKALIVLNCCPPKRGVGEAGITTEARDYLSGGPFKIAKTAITQRAALSHALISGASVTEFEPNGKASDEIKQLWSEIWPALR